MRFVMRQGGQRPHFWIVLAARFFLGALACQAETCADITSDKERLACYDSQAKTSSKAAQQQGLNAALVLKKFVPRSIDTGQYDDQIEIWIEFSNNGEKAVRAFKGAAIFSDALDDRILAVGLSADLKIAAHAKQVWKGGINFNQFKSDHQRLAEIPQENLKLAFHCDKILYSDGTSETFPSP